MPPVKVLGIDEAGRGCVLGDLVIAGFAVHAPDEGALRIAGAGDSKAMAASKRERARERLCEMGDVEVRRIDAPTIDGGNLNALEEHAILSIIEATTPDLVQLDALGHPNTLGRLRARILGALRPGLRPEIVIEPRADATYACVGAASIFAKTLRDEVLDGWREEFGDFGSGYPSDPKTKAWLEAWARTGRQWPHFVRCRWATIEAFAQPALLPISEPAPKKTGRRAGPEARGPGPR
jgi:ribonuclease HII